MSKIKSIPKERRGGYNFLQYSKRFYTIHTYMQVDASNLIKHRNEQKDKKFSYTAYLIYIVSKVLNDFPQLNIAIKYSRFSPKVVQYETINAKFTLDKEVNGERIVLPCLVNDSDKKSLQEIQEIIEEYKYSDYATGSLFKNIRRLSSLPAFLGRMISFLAFNNLQKRHQIQGSFMVTSIGKNGLITVTPLTSSTICFAIGTIKKMPVVVNNEITIRDIMNLSMSFDHAAFDGAVASEFLQVVKQKIENFK